MTVSFKWLSVARFLGFVPARGPSSPQRVTKLAASMLLVRLVLTLVVQVQVAWAGTHLDEPWFRWKDGLVPYSLQVAP